MNTAIKQEKVDRLRSIKPGHVIAGLIAFLIEGMEPTEFSNDSEKWHTAIKKLSEEEKYRSLLKEFQFVNRPPFSYSPLLERVLKRLQEATLLSARNPGYKVYEVTKSSRETLDEIVAKFNPDEQKKLEEMAERLKSHLE